MGTDFTSLGQIITRMINLVAFDVCDIRELRVADTVNPLVKEIRVPLRGSINKELHAFIRKNVKSLCKSQGVYAGKIGLEGELLVTVYLERRIKPAWQPETPEDAPQEQGQ